MDNNEFAYISKSDCEKRGLIKLENGGYYKRNTIEYYAAKGFLDGAKYDVITLVSTANTFYEDYYKAPDWAALKRKWDEEYKRRAYPHLFSDN